MNGVFFEKETNLLSLFPLINFKEFETMLSVYNLQSVPKSLELR